jgi:hypothetical protein
VIKMREDSGFLPSGVGGLRAAGGHSAGSGAGRVPAGQLAPLAGRGDALGGGGPGSRRGHRGDSRAGPPGRPGKPERGDRAAGQQRRAESGRQSGRRRRALGNAEGQGTIIPVAGQVTGTGKTITAADQGGTAATETLHGMIATSADIVPGDSGGPLSTTAGQVIGMDTGKQDTSSLHLNAGPPQ